MQHIISRKHILAAGQAAATKDLRFYLNGVQVEADQNGTRYIGTDGHILFIALDNAAVTDEPFTMIIPGEVVASIPKAKKDPEQLELASMESTRYMLGAQVFTPIDGKFPDWRQVVPSVQDAQPTGAAFNSALVARLRSAFLLMQGRPAGDKSHPVALQYFGELATSGHLASAGLDDCIGIIMPMMDLERERALEQAQSVAGIARRSLALVA